jgi:multidrug efflux pump subunit AcrB
VQPGCAMARRLSSNSLQMNFIAFFVRRFQFTLVIFLLLIAVGWHAFKNIPRAADPAFPIPFVSVIATYPGADSVDMEKLVADPLEDAINQIDDIKTLISHSSDGLAVVRVEFDWSKDPEKKYDEAVREINTARGKLPADLHDLIIEKFNPGNVNIVQLALVGPTTPARTLRETADDLKNILEQVPGVREADIHGLPEKEVQVSVDLARLASFGIPLRQVVDAIRSDNANIPGGAVEVGARRFNLRTTGSYETLEEVGNTVVGGSPQGLVKVQDIATVTWDYEEANYLSRYNGQRAVFISASQKDGANIADVQAGITAATDTFRQQLSPDMKLETGFEQSRTVQARLSRLGLDLGLAIALVLITLLPLGLRAASVVTVSIPLSMAVGVAALYFTGFSLNQLSIAGFVIALGLLVDDSIVVTENIARLMRDGYSRRDAAITATSQISLAVLGCTATLVFAFIPLLFLPEGAGKFIRSLPASVIYTVLASLLVSFTIIPLLASRWLAEHEDPHGNRLLQALMGGIHRIYRPLLRWSLQNPRRMLATVALLCAASFALVPVIGFSIFPEADVPQFVVSVETPEGSSLQATEKAVTFAESVLREHPDIHYVFTNIGHGNPRVFYNVFPKYTNSNRGELFVEATYYDAKKTPVMLDGLRKTFAGYPGARIFVKPFENGPPIDAPIALRIRGPEIAELARVAGEVEALMRKTPGTRDVVNPMELQRTDLDLGIDAEKAAMFGVAPAEIDRTARLAVAGEQAGKFRESDGDEFDITVRLPMQDGHQRLDVLNDIYINSTAGAAVPLAQIAKPVFVTSPTQIQRFQRQRSVTVTAFPVSGYNTEKVALDILAAVKAKQILPPGYNITAAGQVEAREQSFAGLSTAIIVALFGILAVLILEFGNFRSTIIVAGVIPLGVMGGLITLFLSGYTLSFTAMVGFVALLGIEIKNSILLVDFTHQLRATGMPLLDAIQRAGEIRFLPILLTSLTAIGGLMPLAFQQSPMYSPLAWVIIGGLLSSTFLARLVTPVMYFLLTPALEDGSRDS